MEKKWNNRKELNIEKQELLELSQTFQITPAFALILKKREITDISRYLNPDRAYIYDPRLLCGIEKGARIILDHIDKGNKIGIVNDYDVDGVTSGNIMYEAIYYLGGKAVILTPDRFIDGYGISERIVDLAKVHDCRLIVTTDNGIAAYDQISYAKELGIDVVITDHHEVPYKETKNGKEYILPPADAIIDPKLEECTYPFKAICGASVAYKIADVLFEIGEIKEDRLKELRQEVPTEKKGKKIFLLKRFLELVTIATICDVMPLENENRMYVKCGLSLLRNSSFVGLRQLMAVQNVNMAALTSYHIGYVLGPCINAAARMTGSAKAAIDLLLEKDQNRAEVLAKQLKAYNDSRKKQSTQGVALALEMIQQPEYKNENIYFIYLPNINPEICGIIAGKVKDATGHPVIVCSDLSNDSIKCSGRSVKGVNIFKRLNIYKDMFVAFGGHELACGLIMSKVNYDKVRMLVNRDASNINPELFTPTQMIDLFIPMQSIDFAFLKDWDKMGPFGQGNEKPVLCEKNAKIYRISRFGRNNNYLKFYIVSNNEKLEVTSFDSPENFERYITEQFGSEELQNLYNGYSEQVFLDILYTPQVNVWKNVTSIQYIMNDFKKGDVAA